VALYPQDPLFRSVSVGLKFTTDISPSDNGHQQAVDRDGASAEIDIKYNKLSYAEAMRVRAFLVSLRGRAKTCDLILPVESHTMGDIAGSTIQATSLTAGGSNTLVFKNGQPNKTLRYAGEWIQLAGHDKSYMLVSDLVTDASGNGIATFEPALYSQVLANEQIIIDEIKFKVNASSDITKTDLQPGKQYSFSVKFTEAIR